MNDSQPASAQAREDIEPRDVKVFWRHFIFHAMPGQGSAPLPAVSKAPIRDGSIFQTPSSPLDLRLLPSIDASSVSFQRESSAGEVFEEESSRVSVWRSCFRSNRLLLRTARNSTGLAPDIERQWVKMIFFQSIERSRRHDMLRKEWDGRIELCSRRKNA